ncbi:MAG: PspC domain-containing protein, partial [Actinobacteria bacterium]|nr:PspC domain-containing protein [Actinomycetota bacterium]
YWSVDVNIVRVGAILLTIITNIWLGILAYILVVVAIPQE